MYRHVCIGCRKVDFHPECPQCGKETVLVGHRWRPPKKNNDRAWKLIANGEWLWDTRHVNRVAANDAYRKWVKQAKRKRSKWMKSH